MSEIGKLPRADKLAVAKAIAGRLQKRIDDGGAAEPGLDAFQTEINANILRIEKHSSGVAGVKGTRAALLAASDESDDVVDCWLRKHVGFFNAEATRRTGPLAARARALFDAAFPDGLAHVDERVVDENEHCRAAIQVFRAPENADTMTALEVPAGWVDSFEAAVVESDADYNALAARRSEKSSHIDQAQDAEEEWEDILIRFRHHIAGRAKKNDAAKRNESRELIDPLLAAVKKMRSDAEARATLRAKKESAGAGAPAPVSPEAPPANNVPA